MQESCSITLWPGLKREEFEMQMFYRTHTGCIPAPQPNWVLIFYSGRHAIPKILCPQTKPENKLSYTTICLLST